MRPEVKSVRTALDELIGNLGIQKRLKEYDAVLFWDDVVGDHIAKATTPVRIVQGVLVVKVKTSAWRNELTLQKRMLVQRLNDAIGERVVKDIRFQ
jgi:predicted nucleic acid-binding Zn ribbon protein